MDHEKLMKIADGLASCATRMDALEVRRGDAQGRDNLGRFAQSATAEAKKQSNLALSGKGSNEAAKSAHQVAVQAHRRAGLAAKHQDTANKHFAQQAYHEKAAKFHS